MSFLFLHSPPFFFLSLSVDFAVLFFVFPSIGPHAFRPDSMKLRKSILVLAVAAVALLTAAAVKADVEELMDGFGQDYANAERTLGVEEEPVAGFNRGAVEHRPDFDDVRQQQSQFSRMQLMESLNQIKEMGQQDQPAYDDDDQVEANRISKGIYVEEQETYPSSYQGFNGHSYQNEPPVMDELERLVDPVPIDPLSATRNGKIPVRRTAGEKNKKQKNFWGSVKRRATLYDADKQTTPERQVERVRFGEAHLFPACPFTSQKKKNVYLLQLTKNVFSFFFFLCVCLCVCV